MKPFRLCREVNGVIVGIREIVAETVEAAIEQYWILEKVAK